MFEKMNVPVDKSLYAGIDENGRGASANLQFHINPKTDNIKCLNINVSQNPEIENQAEIQIVSENEISMKVKKSATAAIQQEINKVAEYMGHSPFGLKFFTPHSLTFNKYQTIQVTLFFNKKTLTRDDQVNVQRQREKLRSLIYTQIKQLLLSQLGVIQSENQIIIKEKFISEKTESLIS